jgi:16S rRNA (adenine1518-N6/adenine1519-N6)-dimethyltransferase
VRRLGQNFLVDSNILGVIARVAEPAPEDVVLEIGGGRGALSVYLAPRVGHLHVVELDRRLREALEGATGRFQNVTLHWGDAMRMDLGALDPEPGKLISNLPYGIAAGVLLKTVEELPGLSRWVAMVQREVGERLAAAPGSGVYGASSVLAQLACEVRVVRGIPRGVFHPVPKVDSVLIEMRRVSPAPPPALRGLVSGSFAHRRKALARSLTLDDAHAALPRGTREEIRAALVELGHPADVRAERLSPADFRALGEALGI